MTINLFVYWKYRSAVFLIGKIFKHLQILFQFLAAFFYEILFIFSPGPRNFPLSYEQLCRDTFCGPNFANVKWHIGANLKCLRQTAETVATTTTTRNIEKNAWLALTRENEA